MGIFHFFEINDYNLNTKKIKRFMPEDESDHYARDRPYSVKEIEQILNKCDLRSRVAVLLMTSSGLRIGGLRELQIGDIKKLDEFNLHIIWVYNRSRKDRYYTFCSPECSAAIDEYLIYRQKCGEQLKDKSPLIRDNFDIDNPFTAQAPNFISRRGMFLLFEEALNRAKVNPIVPGQKKRAVACSHGFRKFFITQCDKAHLDYTTWKYLAGHKLPITDASYIRTTEEDRLAEYVKAIDLLTIDATKKLQQKVQELESERSKELEVMKAQLMEYKEFAEKTAAEISELKTRKDLHGWGSSLYFVDPNFSNFVDAVNDLRAKNGLEPVANTTTTVTTTREIKAVKAKRIREELRQLTELRRENEHPDYEETKAERIKELQQELKECLL